MRIELVNYIKKIIHKYNVRTILDVGCYDGYFAYKIASKKVEVLSIDIDNTFLDKYSRTNIIFKQISLKNFYLENKNKVFDLVVCENVLPFVPDIHNSITELLSLSDILYFNIWGDKHIWAKGNNSVSLDEINTIKLKISETHEILEYKEKLYLTKTFATPNKLVDWHEFVITAKRK